jgi:MFS family permease
LGSLKSSEKYKSRGVIAGDQPIILIMVTCIAAVLAMLGYAIWPVFLVQLGDSWGLTNTQVGWISGAYFAGYVLATPILVGLTDTVDAKRVFIGGALATFIGASSFATFANGFWSAVLTWAIVGAGLAGTYMPGLQILNARLSDRHRLHAVPIYTSCFGIGTGSSFFINGNLLIYFDYRMAAWLGAAGALVAVLGMLFLVRAEAPPEPVRRRHPLDLRPAFRNPQAMSYIVAYGAHTYELFAFRSWSFALFVFLGTRAQPALSLPLITTIVTLMTLSGMVASIIGARFCLTYNRHRVITLFGAASAGMAVLSAFTLAAPIWVAIAVLCVYNVFIMMDSGALTTGTVSAAAPHDRGALLAVHSMIGFSGGALGGPAVGVMLDFTGGAESLDGWFWAMFVMGIGSVIVAIIQWRFWRRSRANLP